MQSPVAAFFQLKLKRKQRFQVRRQFQHVKYDMNQTLVRFLLSNSSKICLAMGGNSLNNSEGPQK